MIKEEYDRYIYLIKLAENRFLNKSNFYPDDWLNPEEEIEFKDLQIKYLELE